MSLPWLIPHCGALVVAHPPVEEEQGQQAHGHAEVDFHAGMHAAIREAHHVDAHWASVVQLGQLAPMVFDETSEKVVGQGDALL